jgi:hypothetical protein
MMCFFSLYFLGAARACIKNPLAVMEPPADVRRPVTARVDQTV